MNSLFKRKWSLLLIVFLMLQSIIPTWAAGAQYAANNQLSKRETLPDWAEHEINTLRSENIIQGYEDGKFYPDRLISRAEFIAILNRSFGTLSADETKENSDAFSDLDGEWSADEVKKAALKGWAQGFPDGTFRPNQSVNRQDAAVMLNRIIKLSPVKEPSFKDRGTIPTWAASDIAAISEAAILEGYPDSTFRGEKFLTRAEVAVVLFRALEYMRKKFEVRPLTIETLSVTGKPLADAYVFVREKGKRSLLKWGKSGANGKLVLSLPYGMYEITLQKEGYAAHQAIKFEKAKTEFSLKAETAAAFTGKVLVKEGKPADGAILSFTTNPTFITVTGADGAFKVSVLPERNYRMYLTEDDYLRGLTKPIGMGQDLLALLSDNMKSLRLLDEEKPDADFCKCGNHELLRVLKAPKAGESLDIGTVNLSDLNTPPGGGDHSPPAIPTGLQATARIGSAALQWSAVSDADLSGYNVYVSANGGTTWNPAVNAGNVTQYTVTGLTAGVTYSFAVSAVDASGNESAKSAKVDATPTQAPDQTPPSVPAGLQATAGINSAALQWSAVSAADLSGYNVYVSADGGTTWNPAVSVGNVTQYTATGLTAGVTYSFAVSAVDASGNESAKSATAQATPQSPPSDQLPPDPSTVATQLPTTGATTFADQTSFLFTGPTPIQTGVAPDTIKPERTAVLRGKVLDDAGQPLPGAKVTILDHPELGQTLSRADGMFDIAVNGGSRLTVNYEKNGYMSIQRQVEAPWQDYAAIPDVVLKAFDNKVTLVNLNDATEMQVARGNMTTDADGSRTATLLVPAGAKATMKLADGSTAELNEMHFRATEYTVGDNGPKAMPGELPQFVGYTYAIELSADEAVAAGAATVSFDKTLYYYVDNFLQFPVGGAVPVGYYDRETSSWVPSANGRIIEIVATDGGIAAIDSDGDGIADDDTKLNELGFTQEEQMKLAGLYTAGKTLWRVPIQHFTPYDCNWYYKAPDDAIRPDDNDPNPDNPDINDPCKKKGSIIGCEEQSLGESIPLTGTSLSLNYYSRNTPGYKEKSSLHIPVSGDSIPDSLTGIGLKIEIAGRTINKSFPAEPNQEFMFQWDGRDAYGRVLTGSHPYKITFDYYYPVAYVEPVSSYYSAFGRLPNFDEELRPRENAGFSYQNSYKGVLESPENPYGENGIAGWSINTHNILDEANLYLGNGSISERVDQTVGAEIKFRGDASNPDSLVLTDTIGSYSQINNVMDADGSIIFSAYAIVNNNGSNAVNNNVYRLAKDGTLTRWNSSPLGQGSLNGFALDKDGSLYTSEWGKYQIVKRTKANPDNPIVVAGNGALGVEFGDIQDGADAKSVSLYNPRDIEFGKDGSIYFIDSAGLFKVNTDGTITVLHQRRPLTRDNFGAAGGFATQSNVGGLMQALEIGPDGSLYVLDHYMNACLNYYYCTHSRIRKIDPQGQISLVAGLPAGYFPSTGKQYNLDKTEKASEAVFMTDNIEIDQTGNIYFIEKQTNQLFRITPDGKVEEVAHAFVEQAVNVAKNESGSTVVRLVSGGPDSELSIATLSSSKPGPDRFYQYQIGKSRLDNDHVISDSNGTLLFEFDKGTGLHKRTLDTMTGKTVQSFGYDAQGRLASVTDGDGNTVVIERNAQGIPTAVIAPGSQRTELTVENRQLMAVTNPSGESYRMQYDSKGLLTQFEDPRNQKRDYGYDAQGLLTDAKDPGGEATLTRTYFDGGNTITYTKYGQTTTYKTSQTDGVVRHDITDPSGALTTSYIRNEGMEQEVHYPSGVVVTSLMKADPLFGQEALLLDSMTVTTPAGRSWTFSEKRSVETGNATHPLDLKKMTVTYKTTDNKSGKTTTSTVQYDAVAKKLIETSSQGYQTITTYDDNSRAIKAEYPGQNIDPIAYQYDAKGRLAQSQQGSQFVQYTYDDQNNLVKTQDAHGSTKEYGYDSSGRMTGVKLNGKDSIQKGYDANGNMTSITMPNQSVYRQSFNSLDEFEGFLPEGEGIGSKSFHKNGLLDYTLLPSGKTVDYTYDAGGRMTGMNDADIQRTFTYKDNTDRVSKVESVNSAVYGVKQTIDYTYDGNDVMKMTWSGKAAGQFDYTYDSFSKPTNIKAVVGGVTTNIPIGWDDDDNLKTFGPFSYMRVNNSGFVSSVQEGAAGAAFKVDKGYDTMGRVNSEIYSVKGAEIYRVGQEFDDRGWLTRKTVKTSVTEDVYDYSYDSDGQLETVKVNGTMQEQYSYDVNRNRLTRAIGGAAPEISVYNPYDQLQNANNVQYQYDKDGFLTQRDNDVFRYGSNGELLQAVTNGKTIRYTYDALGRRTAREDGTGTMLYLYGNPLDAQQVTSSVYGGTVTTYYYDEGGLLLSLDRGGARYYVVTDNVGTPQEMYDKNGSKVKSYQFDSFGVLLSDSNPAFFLPIGYAGGIADPDTKLVHFGFRDYDPAAGRWTARDPILYNSGQANLYAYVNNNPVLLRDPCGLFCVGFSAYAGLGAGVKICADEDGVSACGEAGVGIGGGFEVDPFENIANDGVSVEATAKLKTPAGGISGGVKYKQNFDGNCPEFGPILKADVGPFSVDLLSPSKSGRKFKLDGLKGGPSWDLKNIKPGLKAEAAIKGKVCGSIRHP
ncbi:S-layer homology domain-containing protein [Paenibacillus andongensis]|uniref:S-layer homology domain-containing protein n=1 Tax=Paenibacillus andongensis TaxID=2975482 RepID=UPI0021BA68FE|nr:S-layer homology domain-containing protein [Paenibacillus andongensis]